MEVARAKIAGFDARELAARLKFDAGGLAIERLSIRDLGDTSFAATGRIQTQAAPGGSITVTLNARDLNGGVVALADRFAPALGRPLRWLAARQKTATLQANVSMEGSGSDSASGKIGLSGMLGAVRLNLTASATGKREAFALTDLGALSGADVQIGGLLQADTTGPLLAMLGLDRVVGDEKKAAQLEVSAKGPLGSELAVEAKLAAGPVDAAGTATLRLPSERPALLDFNRFAGAVGGSKVQGRWTLRFEDMPRVDAMIEAEDIAAPAAIAAAIGAPPRSGSGGWSADPIAWGPTGLTGRIEFKAQRVAIMPWLVAPKLTGEARFEGSEVRFENLAGELGGGEFSGRLGVSHGAGGVAAKLSLALNGADIGAVVPGGGRPASSGRLTLQAQVEGAGRSPAAFIGSLAGAGTLQFEQARLVGLNPRVFGAVTRAVELGIPTEGQRLREFVTGAMDNAGLSVPKASATIGIAGGQARLRDIKIEAEAADLQATVNVDLSDAMLDALLTLNAAQPQGPAQPALMVAVKGPLPEPTRSIDTTLLSSWLTLRAVEQQSKHLEAMERAAREAAAAAAAAAAAQTQAPPPDQPAAAAPERPPAPPSPAGGGVSGEAAAPPLPPPVTIPAAPTAPRPRAAPPRTDGTPPQRSSVRPELLGSQN
jgi:large subunit ribosomal protein L24